MGERCEAFEDGVLRQIRSTSEAFWVVCTVSQQEPSTQPPRASEPRVTASTDSYSSARDRPRVEVQLIDHSAVGIMTLLIPPIVAPGLALRKIHTEAG